MSLGSPSLPSSAATASTTPRIVSAAFALPPRSAQAVSSKQQQQQQQRGGLTHSSAPSYGGGAMTSGNNTSSVTPSTIRGRKRTASSRLPAKLKEPAAVARRNARERRRVKMVNDGFVRLRKHVPTDPKNKKLSKVKTLRLAIDYIKHLQQILTENASKPTQLLPAYTLPSMSSEDFDGVTAAWLQDGLARSHRELDEEIFQSINPARLRKSF